MKKLLVAVAMVALALFAKADVKWSWWMENGGCTPDFSLGLATRCQSVKAFELALLYGASPVQNGVQFTFLGLNDADSVCPLQLAFVNRGKSPTVQLGFANIASSSVFDMGFVNVADEAKFQLGFVNFNKKGFLPVFIFVNFDPSIFE